MKALDADVISIENSKSDLKLLNVFERESFGAGLGPGLYDIHSPRVPSVEEMAERLAAMRKYLPVDSIWLNPDCGMSSFCNLTHIRFENPSMARDQSRIAKPG